MKRHDPNELQTCPVCNKSVYGNMDRHMRTHDKVKSNYECEICNTKYATRTSLKYHWHSVHSESEFYCDVCNNGKNFKTKLGISRHMKVHANEVEIEKPALDIENFQLEWLRAQQDKMQNQQCPTLVDADSKRETDSPINRTANICSKCGKAYARKDKLESHMKRHDQSRWKICPICNKSFPDGLLHQNLGFYSVSLTKLLFVVGLQRHMKTHLKIKEHVCDICGLAYKQVCDFSRSFEKLETLPVPSYCVPIFNEC